MPAIHREYGFTLIHPIDGKRFAIAGNPMSYQRRSPKESTSVTMFAVREGRARAPARPHSEATLTGSPSRPMAAA